MLTATSPAVTLDIDATVAGLRMEAEYNAAVTTAAAKTLTVTASATLAAGTVDGAGTLKVTGTFAWTGGAMRGTGTTRLEGTSTLGPNAKTRDARRLENAGTVDWQGGNLNVSNGATIANLAGATFDLKNNVSILNAGGFTSTFDNNGTFKKTLTAGISQVQVDFNNNNGGTVQVDVGVVNFGHFTQDGTIDGAGEINITGDFTWKSGLILDTSDAQTGIIRLGAGTTALFLGQNIMTLFKRPMENFGTVTWIDGMFALNGSSRALFTNKAGATFKIRGGTMMSGTVAGTFQNEFGGTVVKEAGPGYELTLSPMFFNNDGTFNVDYGNVVMHCNGEHTGQFHLRDQAIQLTFDGNFTNTFKTRQGSGAPLLGVDAGLAGHYEVNNGMTLIVDQPNLCADFLVLGAAGTGKVTGTGTLIATRLDWRTGDMTDTGTTVIPAGGQLNILLATARTMDKRHLIIQRVATWTNDDITVSNGATINLDGVASIFDIQCDKKIENGGNAGKFTIDKGLLKKSAGTGQTIIEMEVETKNGGQFDDSGKKVTPKSLKNLSGIINSSGGGVITVLEWFQQDGGTTSVQGGTLAVLGALAESGGTVSVAGAGAAVSVGGATTVSGGTLTVQLAGTFTASSSFTQTGGDVSVLGSGSVVSVTGTFQQTGGTTTLGGTGGRLSMAGSVVASGSAILTLQNGLLDATGSVTIQAGATLNGYGGFITGDVTNAGTLNLSGGVYTLTISGNYTQTGTLKVGLASSCSYSRLSVSGVATLGGTLHVDLLGGFMPAPGMGFSVLTYGSRSGTFGALELPPLGFGHWNPQYDNPTGTFTLWVTYF